MSIEKKQRPRSMHSPETRLVAAYDRRELVEIASYEIESRQHAIVSHLALRFGPDLGFSSNPHDPAITVAIDLHKHLDELRLASISHAERSDRLTALIRRLRTHLRAAN